VFSFNVQCVFPFFFAEGEKKKDQKN